MDRDFGTMAYTDPAVASRPFTLTPLMFETFACSTALMSFVTLAGPVSRVLGLAPWQAGLAVTMAGVAWMLTSTAWGRLSDRQGRRKVLLLGLAGFAISHLLLSVFLDLALRISMISWLAFGGLVIGRTIAGGFYAAVPTTAAAVVADNVPSSGRASALAIIGTASAVGMMIGPAVAGLIGGYDLSLALYATAALPIIAFGVMWRMMPADGVAAVAEATPLSIGDARIRLPIIAMFSTSFVIAVVEIIVGFFVLDRFDASPTQAAEIAGVALAVVGLALVPAQLAIIRLGWTPLRLIRIGAVVAATGLYLVLTVESALGLWFCYGVTAIGMGWVFPAISALAANSVEASEQGAAAGAVAAAQGLGTVTGPIAATGLYGFGITLPYALAATLLLACAFLRPAERADTATPAG